MGCIITKTGSNTNLEGKIRAMLMKAKKEDSADAKIAFIKRRIKEIRDELDITDPESLEVFADLVTEMTSKRPNIYKEVFENGGLDPLFVLTAKGDNVETVTEDSSNTLKSPEQRKSTDTYTRDFLVEAFGTAQSVKNLMDNYFRVNIAKSFIIDRDNGKIISSTEDMNKNLKSFQEELLSNVIDYLRYTYNGKTKEDKEIIKKLENITLYKDGVYLNTLDTVKEIADTLLLPENNRSKVLEAAYVSAKNGNIKNQKFIKAYYSYVLLNNFDGVLKSELGKAIYIKNFGHYTDGDKYSLSDNVANNGRRYDEKALSPDEVIDDVLRLIVETSPMYRWNSSSPIDGLYMKPEHIHSIISKIKSLTNNPETKNIIFNTSLLTQVKSDTISKYVNNPDFENKSLYTIITSIRTNPQKYLKALFDILSDDSFYSYCNDLFKNTFYINDKDVLYSVYKNIFEDGGHSLYSIWTKDTTKNNYYKYFTVDADYTSPIIYTQYALDDNGNIEIRELKDSENMVTRRSMERIINGYVGYISPDSVYDKILKSYPAKFENGKFFITIPEAKLKVTFDPKIPNTNAAFSISRYKDSEPDTFLPLGSLTKEDWNNLSNYFTTFIREKFSDNFSFGNIYLSLSGDKTIQYNSHVKDLLQLSSSIYFNSYFTKKLVKTRSQDDVNGLIKQTFGETNKLAPILGKSATDISLISEIFLPLMTRLALAHNIDNGISSKSVLKTGEKTNIAATSLAQLSTDIRTQFEKQCSIPYDEKTATGSACAHFPIISDPKLFRGNSVSKEYVDKNTVKQRTAMNVAENYAASLIYDYFLSIEKGELVKFVPSTNSDKSNVPTNKIDLNVILKGQTKAIKDWSEPEIYNQINKVIGKFYSNVLNSIQYDLRILTNYANTPDGKQILSRYVANEVIFNGLLDLNIFTNFFTFNQAFGSNAYKALNELARNYNLSHRKNPIHLTDQVHIINQKGYLRFNRTLISVTHRFNPEYFGGKLLDAFNIKDENGIVHGLTNADDFWKEKRAEVLEDLLRNKFSIDTVDEAGNLIQSPEIELLSKYYNSWISPLNGKFILAKYTPTGSTKAIPITKLSDFAIIKKVENKWTELPILDANGRDYSDPKFEINSLPGTLVLNPLIAKFNALHYYITQQYVLGSVGTHLAHDAKEVAFNPNDNIEEAARFASQCKRNGVNSATMKQFHLGDLQGIPSTYTISIIDDIKKAVYNIEGKQNTVKPYDGATFVNPFIVMLENYSLGGSSAGVNKKPIVHAYDERTGNAIFIKTAGFGLTNANIKNSERNRNIMRKMTNIVWTDQNDRKFICDINYSYRKYFDSRDGKIKHSKINYGDLYYRNRGGQIIRLNRFEYLGNNNYRIWKQKVSEKGKAIGKEYPVEREVNTNYALWKMFGGYNSVEFNGEKFIQSENSIKAVVKAMNEIGIDTSSTGEYLTQDDLYQPLKYSDIHWAPTIGAVKVGPMNINPESSCSDTKDLNFGIIKMNTAGIQLDPTHHADNSTVTLFTQVISAACSRGFTADKADSLYRALASLSKFGIKNLYNSYEEYVKTGDKTSFENSITSIVAKSLVDSSKKDNLASAIAQDLMDKYKSGKKLTFKDVAGIIPWSDSSIFSLVLSSITSSINRSSIKPKFFGNLAVLNPSEDIYKLYGGRTLDSFNNISEIVEIQKDMDAIPIDISNVKLERTYTLTHSDGTRELFETDSPEKYWKLRKLVDNGDVVKINEAVVSFIPSNMESMEIGKYYMIDSQDGSKNYFQIEDSYDLEEAKYFAENKYVSEIKLLGRNLAPYHVRFTGINSDDETFTGNIWDLDSVKIKFELEKFRKNINDPQTAVNFKGFALANGLANSEEITNMDAGLLYKEVLNRATKNLQNDLLALGDNDEFRTVKINNKYYTVDKKHIITEAYELIMPMIYRTQFGLEAQDDVYNISRDPNFFFRRALNNFKSKVSDNLFDIELKRLNGKHIYLRSKSNFKDTPGLSEVYFEKRRDGDTVYRVADDGTPIHKLASENDKIYQDYNGNEIIVTDNLVYYLDNNNYHNIRLSDTVIKDSHKLDSIKTQLELSSKKSVKSFLNFISKVNSNVLLKNNIEKSINEALRNVDSIEFKEVKTYNDFIIKNMMDSARKIHTSFMKSLEVLAARIPAQSMQSFMPMETVSFIKADTNDAYVSRWQIWLQGSDYDVDKVTLLGYSFNRNGEYIGWSNFFDYDSIESLKISEKIPYPTGEELKIEHEPVKDFIKPSPNDTQAFFEYQNKLENYNKATKKVLDKFNEIKPYIDELVVDNGKLSLSVDNKELFPEVQLDNLRKLVKVLKIIESDNSTIYIPKEAYADSEFKRKVDYFKKRIDEHNLYINTHKYLEEDTAKNMIASTVSQISLDPSNLIQAQSSVDDMTVPLKTIANESPYGSKDKRNAPGNSVIYPQVLVNNMTGKDVIAISASQGLKCFYALTQYYNTVLNNGNSKQLNRLLFYKKIGNTEARLLANAWIKDSSKLKNTNNDEVFQVLLSVMDNQNDAALVLSAILSLATDNAKELALSKLNAGSDMVGLYLYGIMIGMDFRDISKILISKSAQVIANMQKGNIFNHEEGHPMLTSIFKTLDTNPPMPDTTLRKIKDTNNNTLLYHLKVFSGSPNDAKISDIKSNILELINNNSKEEVINRLYSLKNKLLGYGENGNLTYTQSRLAIAKYFDSLETFIRNKLIIKSDIDENGNSPYEYLKDLYYGYAELQRLNKMLSLNQGIKVLLNDKLSFIRSVENIINDRYVELYSSMGRSNFVNRYGNDFDNFSSYLRQHEDYYKGEYTISLDKFCFDEDYRNTIIDFYDSIKHTFNIFDVVWNVPHYKQYLIDSVIDEQGGSISSKFRTIRRALDEVLIAYNATSAKEKRGYTKATLNFIDTILNNSWLKTREPIVTENSAIVLGTRGGNTAFKEWMEETVIPNLKSNNLGAGNTAFLHNKFIDDINPVSVDRTATKQPISVYMLPVNMLTKSTSEQNLLDGYKIDFNNLRYRSYYVKSGDTIHEYPITDLFFYYNLINYKNATNQNSLTPLYEAMNRSGDVTILKDYNGFISNFDSNSNITENIDYTKEDLFKAVAPVSSEFMANRKKFPYFYSYDGNHLEYKLKQRTDEAKEKDNKNKYIPSSEESLSDIDEAISIVDEAFDMSDDVFGMSDDIYGGAFDFADDSIDTGTTPKEEKSNYKLVDEVSIRDSRFNPDRPLNTFADRIITDDIISSKEPIRIGTMTVVGERTSNGLLPKEIKYRGKVYNTLELLNVAKATYSKEINDKKLVEPKLEDLYIPTKEVFIDGDKKVIVDFENFQNIIDYIFNNPC